MVIGLLGRDEEIRIKGDEIESLNVLQKTISGMVWKLLGKVSERQRQWTSLESKGGWGDDT
jgi:hypothetical protein